MNQPRSHRVLALYPGVAGGAEKVAVGCEEAKSFISQSLFMFVNLVVGLVPPLVFLGAEAVNEPVTSSSSAEQYPFPS